MPGPAIYRLAAMAHTDAWFREASALCETSYTWHLLRGQARS